MSDDTDEYGGPDPEAVLEDVVSSPSKGGRPQSLHPDERTLQILSGLRQIFATRTEAAAMLHVSLPTLNKLFRESEAARDAWADGFGVGKVSLRRKQLKLCDRSATMAIHLGVNFLGQKNAHELSGPGGGAINVNFGRMTSAQLDRFVDRVDQEVEALDGEAEGAGDQGGEEGGGDEG